MITMIGLDADDTLWHNESIFQLTQTRFAGLLQSDAERTTVEQCLLAAERRNIHHYGFGIKGFVLSMIETAIEVTDGRVWASVIKEILDAGRWMLDHPVELLPGVKDAVERLAADYRLILITKGDLFDQERKIAQSGLDHLFDRTEIVSEKDAAAYQRIFSEQGGGPGDALMIGNSLKSDVLPAIQAGAIGIHVPYHVTFALEHADPPDDRARFYQCRSLEEVPELLASLDPKNPNDLTGENPWPHR